MRSGARPNGGFDLRVEAYHQGSFTRIEVPDIAPGRACIDGTPRMIRFLFAPFIARWQEHRALQNERLFSNAMIESMPGIVYFYDAAGHFLRWNTNFETVSGYTGAEIAKMHPLDFFAPEDKALLEQRIGEVFERGESSVEAPFVAKDGTRTLYFFTGKRVTYEGRVCLVGAGVDISVRVRLEEQVRQAQKMQAIGNLSAGVAHEFNNALATISGNVQLALVDAPASHPAHESLQEIDKASERGKRVVEQLLAFSNPPRNERQALDLGEAVADSLESVRKTLPAAVELRFRADPATPRVVGDAFQIKQVVINLCKNAIQALAETQGHIAVDVAPVLLDVEGAAHVQGLSAGAHARLTVSDDGPGMDAATLQRAFEPFFTTKAPGKGTGLGLPVVHGILQAHRGAVSVRSEPGKGATFELYFPAAPVEAESSPAAPAVERNAARGNGERILFIDDEQALVHLANRMLTRMGYRVRAFSDAQEAIEAFRSDPDEFDLVITDYSMPGPSGLDVATELHALRPDIPVVLCSGHLSDELRERARLAGIRHLLYKPSSLQEFGDAIHRLVGAR